VTSNHSTCRSVAEARLTAERIASLESTVDEPVISTVL
jgi:hypothetical protein